MRLARESKRLAASAKKFARCNRASGLGAVLDAANFALEIEIVLFRLAFACERKFDDCDRTFLARVFRSQALDARANVGNKKSHVYYA